MNWSKWLAVMTVVLAVGCGSDDPANPSKNNTNPNNNTNNTVNDMGSDASDATNNTVADMGGDDGLDMTDPGCQDECAAGEQVCSDTAGYQTCGQYDLDVCLELSPIVACAVGYSCETDRCVPPCRDECPVGGTICVDNDTVAHCGNFDADFCRESGAPIDCDAGERCEQGACIDSTLPCSDECTTAGESICFGDTTRVCGNFDSDTCLDLGAPVSCGLGQQCSAGQCVSFCTDECSTAGETECAGDGVRTCGDNNNDGCFEWSPVVGCAGGTFCSSGSCVDTCVDECANAGQFVCTPDGSGVSSCGQYDGDLCLDRSSGIPCPGGFSCQGGLCIASCTNDCNPGDAPQCATAGQALQTCGNYDADPCFEWGGDVTCPGGAACSAGSCQIPCTDECTTNGTAVCNATNTGFSTCGQWDVDSCLENSQETACQNYEVCSAGACELGPTPNAIVINEILVNSPGTDSQSGNILFIELFGPANVSLDGYVIAGVNGSDGATYNSITLNGEVMGADGYFVIAHPAGAPELLALADLTDSKVDFQNGPDSVQLRWRTRVVDAIGYGTFGANDTFAGEGTGIAAPSEGQSLSRNAAHADTDDNSADFAALAVPSPRGNVATCMDDCSMNATRCSGTSIEYCGNYDADACLEWGGAAACPVMGESCVGTTCQAPCSNECPAMGDTQCLGQQVSTCGNYDADSCVEWSVASNCPGTQVCIANACQDPTAPEVVLISPQGTIQTTQGNTHRILADATPYAGRQIASVKYYANGVELGTTTATPHEFFYTIPANQPTNSQVTIQAKAQDSLGLIGNSGLAYLDVKNDAPLATFTATITNTTTVTVDGSAVSDTETSGANLEVCWDWNDDGVCETAYSTTKITSHDFGASGTYTVRMKVRDAVGQTAETTRQVSFADIQYIGGSDVTTTLWYGTIIVTGDINIPAGNTLTIAPGTDVLFVYADVDAPANVGDYRITVAGNLLVNGTAAEPVVFSGQSQTAKKKGGWDRIVLTGAGSVINHAIIEYGDVGLEAKSNVVLNNVEIRQAGSDCIRLDNADNASLTDVTTHDCANDGVAVLGGSIGVLIDQLSTFANGQHGLSEKTSSNVTLTNSSFATNGQDGINVSLTSTLNLSESTVENNIGAGIRMSGNTGGSLQHNKIRQNGAEGVGLVTDASGSPSPVIQYNNIYSNASTGSAAVTVASPNISASQTCCATSTSSLYTAPVGAVIRRVYVNYDEGTDSSSRVSGKLLDGAGLVIRSFTSDFAGWVYVPDGATGLRVSVTDTGASGSVDTITITSVEYVEMTGDRDVVTAADSGTVDMRYNYLGTFPNVLGRVAMSRTNALNLHGFVGVAFGPTWDVGPYKAGSVGGQTWSGTIYVTGDVTVAANEVLNIAAGTQVLFVNHDQDLDLDGDFSITATGSMVVNGAIANVVRFAGYGAIEPDMFQTINLNGSGANASSWSDVLVENGKTSVTLRGGSTLTRVEARGDSGHGFHIVSGSGATLTRCIADGAASDGLHVTSATLVAVSRLTTRNNVGDGVVVESNATLTMEDSTIRDNGGHGIRVERASPALNYNLITYNGGDGIHTSGQSSPTITYSVIKFNDGAGISAWTGSTGSATPVANYNNIYANAVTGNVTLTQGNAGLSASQTCCSTSTSGIYSAPVGSTMQRVYVNYNEGTDSSSRVSGQLLTSTGTVVRTFTSDFVGWVYLDAGVTGIRVNVTDTGASGSVDTIAAQQVDLVAHDPATSYEFYSATDTGISNAKFNYWTPDIGNVPTKINQLRSGSVDYTGFTGAEYPSGMIMAVGPRP